MTRALVTKLVDALNKCRDWPGAHDECSAAITVAREYLANEPSGERAELITRLAKQWAELDPVDPYRADIGQAVSMLEADAQQAKPPYDQQALELCNTCGWKGIFPGDPCLVCAQQAKRVVPMTITERSAAWVAATIEMPSHENCYLRGMIDAEYHHGITEPAEKPTDWSAA